MIDRIVPRMHLSIDTDVVVVEMWYLLLYCCNNCMVPPQRIAWAMELDDDAPPYTELSRVVAMEIDFGVGENRAAL